jgi:acetylornithine/N-succinyldiaminopimelate aminotransferase
LTIYRGNQNTYLGMEYKRAVELEKKRVAQVFSRLPVLITKGDGVYVFDEKGRKYLDLFAGVAVSSVGHSHPLVLDTIRIQSAKLIHTSNWVYTEPQLMLADKLVKLTQLERVFFTNDGAGAVETSLKLARKHTGRKEIISMENSFHGRSMGALSATWTPKYRTPFEPLVPGFKFARYNDIESLKSSISAETAAVIVEPIQGEAGVLVPDGGYLKAVRDVTKDNGSVMIVDEVQTGFGRTGKWFDYQRAKIKPDIVCLAKGMGGGFPIGAVAYAGMDFEKGQQGGTYNGNPLACAVSETVLEIIEREKLVSNAERMGSHIMRGLKECNVHGRGLMLGVEVDDGLKRSHQLIKEGAIAIYSGNTLRILPPLTITMKHADEIIRVIKEVT